MSYKLLHQDGRRNRCVSVSAFVWKILSVAVVISCLLPSARAGELEYRSPILRYPVISISPIDPNNADSQDLGAIDAKRAKALASALQTPDGLTLLAQIDDAEISDLDGFLAKYPQSGWSPSLHAILANYYREHGQYTKALNYWEAAWQVTGAANNGAAKEIADFTLAHWTRLLASLGRVETLDALMTQNADRVFTKGGYAQMWARTREAYFKMIRHPEIA